MTEESANGIALWASDPRVRGDLHAWLSGQGFRALATDSQETLRGWIDAGSAELIVAELSRAFQEPLDFLNWVETRAVAAPVVMVIPDLDVALYLEAMRRGAFDCVGLPLNQAEASRVLFRALEASSALTLERGA